MSRAALARRPGRSRSVVSRARRLAPITAPALAVAVIAGLGGASARAVTNYYWDPNGSLSGGSASGGSGTWDNGTTADWYPGTGSADVVWPNTTAAVFNGSAGTVTLGSNVTAVGMTFTTSGYVLATGAYTLLDTGQVNFNSNVTITGTGGMVETTGATLIVTNAVGATLTVGAGGILDLAGPANSSQAPSYRNNAANTSLTLAGGTIIANGVIDIAHSNNTGTINLTSGLLTTSYGFGTDSGSNVGSINFGGATLAITQSLSDLIDPTVNTNFVASTSITLNDVAGGGGAIFNTSSFTLGLAEGIKHSDPAANGLVDGGITKLGSGTLTLSGASNTYTGGVTVVQGTVTAASTTALGSATATVGLSLTPATGTTAAVNVTAATGTVASLSSSGAGTSTLVLGNYNGSSAGTATTLTIGNANVLATSSTTFAGVISNASTANGATGSLVKTGPGTLTLSASNTFTGGVSLASGSSSGNNGVLVASASGALGTGTINTDPSGNAELGQVQLVGGITLANPISSASRTVATLIANPNFLNVSGNNTLSGNIATGGGGIGFALASNGGTLTASGTFASGGRLLDLGGTATGIFSGVISSTASVEKDGTGTWTLSAGNTYSAGTTVNAGLLVATSTTGDSLGTGSVTVAAGAQLQIQDHAGGVPSLPNAFTLSGSGTAGGGALIFYNSSFNTIGTGLTGTTTLAADTTVRIDPAVQGTSLIDFRGVISGAGGLTLFTQNTTTHATVYKFDAANTYGTGGTASNLTTLLSSSATSSPLLVELATVTNPLPVTTTLTFGGTPAGAPAGTFNKAVTLELDGISQTVAGLAVGLAPATTGGYSIVGNSATPSLLTVNNAVANIFGGVIGGAATNNNNIGLVKTGAGTLALSGVSTYTAGTTITGGTLQTSGTSPTGTGAVTVGDGANANSGVLAGTGSIANGANALTIALGGTVTAGTGVTTADSIGNLSTGAQAWNAGGTYVSKFAADNSSNDRLIMTGVSVAGSGPFVVDVSGTSVTALAGGTYVLAVETGTPYTTNADPFTLAALQLQVNGSTSVPAGFALAEQDDTLAGGTGLGGVDLVLTATPEPTSLLLAGLAAAPLALGRRRRSMVGAR
jgi:fibronectin-binding autotransporter adhesin